jgi:integrase
MTRSRRRASYGLLDDPASCRFFVIGWYTGSRRSVIAGLKWSMVNLETGVMQRKEHGAIQTKKRSPARRMGNRLLCHMRRWNRMDGKGRFTSSTSADARLTVLSARGSGLEMLRAP